MPSWVGNGADVRREQRKQIALQGFTQCPPGWEMAQTRAESNINQAGLQGPTRYAPWWVMTQTRAESRENRLPCKVLPNAHLGG